MSFAKVLEAEHWIQQAPVGAETEYFRGNLQTARECLSKAGYSINGVADVMLGHAGTHMPREKRRKKRRHKLALYQIRHGVNDYSYMARKVCP